MFADAVHPEYQSRAAHGWFLKGQKIAVKTTSGRKRLNFHAAHNLENVDLAVAKADKINAMSFRKLLKKIEADNTNAFTIYFISDNVSFHPAKKIKSWSNKPERRVKLIIISP